MTEMYAQLVAEATRLEGEAAKYRKAANFLAIDPSPSNGNGNTPHPTRGYRHAPRRERAVRAITKHGPLTPSQVCAYTGIHRKDLKAHTRIWGRSGHVRFNETTNKYELVR